MLWQSVWLIFFIHPGTQQVLNSSVLWFIREMYQLNQPQWVIISKSCNKIIEGLLFIFVSCQIKNVIFCHFIINWSSLTRHTTRRVNDKIRLSSTHQNLCLYYYKMSPWYLISRINSFFSRKWNIPFYNTHRMSARNPSNIHKWILHAPFTIANAKQILQTLQNSWPTPATVVATINIWCSTRRTYQEMMLWNFSSSPSKWIHSFFGCSFPFFLSPLVSIPTPCSLSSISCPNLHWTIS